jgi:hypothetical protein
MLVQFQIQKELATSRPCASPIQLHGTRKLMVDEIRWLAGPVGGAGRVQRSARYMPSNTRDTASHHQFSIVPSMTMETSAQTSKTSLRACIHKALLPKSRQTTPTPLLHLLLPISKCLTSSKLRLRLVAGSRSAMAQFRLELPRLQSASAMNRKRSPARSVR